MSDAQVKSIIERILKLHAEEAEIAADRREIYAEAKAAGYDKTALGDAVRAIRHREKVGEAAVSERETIAGLYLAAYDGPSHVHVGAHARDANENAGYAPSLSGSADESRPVATEEEVHHEIARPDLIAASAPNSRIPELQPPAGAQFAGSAVRAGATFTLPVAKPLRPHCQSPDRCGSYGSKHCGPCIRTASLTEAA